MSSGDDTARTPRRRRGRHGAGFVIGGVAAVAAIAALAVAVVVVRDLSWRRPQFRSLAVHPDTSLHGTVAYLDDRSGCVRIVAAAGSPSRTVLCLPKQDPRTAVKLGKEIGPQLLWLPGGRLQVTMFRMLPPAKPGAVPPYRPGWQKIVNVRTGATRDVPADLVPSRPTRNAHPLVSPDGRRITWASDPGQAAITLTEGGRSRTLLSVQGPAESGYRLQAAFWSPDWQWIAADDGRILVITTGRHPVVRVLTAASSQIAFSGEFSRFAVTSENLLAPGR